MHELSLAQALLDQLRELAAEHGAESVKRAEVLVGPASGVVTDSFVFGFSALRLDHPVTRDCELCIVSPARTFRCPACSHEFSDRKDSAPFRNPLARGPDCPACGGRDCLETSSSELILKHVEME